MKQKYYNATEASKELGISKQDLIKMVQNNEIKAGKKKGSPYRIPEKEIKRLANRLEQKEIQPNKSKNMPQRRKHYTATEASEKLDIPRSRIMVLIKKGKIQTIKGKAPTSPYLIPEAEMQKLRDISVAKTVEKKSQLP